MPRPRKQTDITDFALVSGLTPKSVLLYVRDALHEKPDGKQYYPSNVSTSTKSRLIKFGDVRRIEYCDR